MKTESIVEKIKKSNLPIIEQFLILLLVRNGLRVSEITHTENIKLIDLHTVSVWQRKTKSFRTAKIADFQENIDKIFVGSVMREWNRNRQYYYRLFDKLGISQLLENHKNRSVTHLPRHIRANDVYAATKSMDLVSKELGHKSLRSASHYVKVEPQRTALQRGVLNPSTGVVVNLRVARNNVIYMRTKKSN